MLRNEGGKKKKNSEYRGKVQFPEVYLETRSGFKAFVAQTIDLYAVGKFLSQRCHFKKKKRNFRDIGRKLSLSQDVCISSDKWHVV